jgi:hypothetical protein
MLCHMLSAGWYRWRDHSLLLSIIHPQREADRAPEIQAWRQWLGKEIRSGTERIDRACFHVKAIASPSDHHAKPACTKPRPSWSREIRCPIASGCEARPTCSPHLHLHLTSSPPAVVLVHSCVCCTLDLRLLYTEALCFKKRRAIKAVALGWVCFAFCGAFFGSPLNRR